MCHIVGGHTGNPDALQIFLIGQQVDAGERDFNAAFHLAEAVRRHGRDLACGLQRQGVAQANGFAGRLFDFDIHALRRGAHGLHPRLRRGRR